MADLVLSGNTSGTVTISVPAVAGTNTATVPAQTGTLQMIGVGTAVNSTSGTAIDFTGIPSWVKRITVMFSGVSTSGASPIQIQLGDSGGIENTGYLGYTVYTGSTSIAGADNFSSGFYLPFIAAAAIIHGQYIFTKVDGNTWAGSGLFGRSDGLVGGLSAGSKALSSTLNRVRITSINGTDTFDAGTLNILYEG